MSFKLPMPGGGGCTQYLPVHIFIYKYVQLTSLQVRRVRWSRSQRVSYAPPPPLGAELQPAEPWEVSSTASMKEASIAAGVECAILGRGAEPPHFWGLLIWLEPGLSHDTWVHYDATMCLPCLVCSALPVLPFLRFGLFVL